MILTNARGEPLARPERGDFPSGIEGDVAFLRASCAFHDRVSALASGAFARRFRHAVSRQR